jgi:ParB family transcriptional regulator, chromosome partitioning protein
MVKVVKKSNDLKIESVTLDSIKPDPQNVRVHPEENIQAIMRSLTANGQLKPIVVWRGIIIAGNGTYESAKRLGWSHIQIVRCDGLDENQVKAYAIADNKTTDMSHFDFEMLASVMRDLQANNLDLSLTGFQNFEVEPLLQAEWNPGEVGEMPEGSSQSGKKISFTDEQWEVIEQALTKIRETESEFSTESDADALTALCYRFAE